jgi:glycosyltransferase involved in cell wall biosynthesis
MRILYCNKYNYAFSGTEAYLFELMDLMRSQGHEVALFSMADERGKPTPYDRYFVRHLDFKQSHGVLHQVKLAGHAIYSSEARKRLRALIEEFRPDMAHVRNIYHHLSPSVLWELKAQRIPVIYHLNDFKLLCPSYNMVAKGHACERCSGGQFWRVISEGCYPGPRGTAVVLAAEAYFHKWLHTYQKCIDCFLAPSQFVKDKLVERGWDAKRVEVLPHFQRLPEHAPQEPEPDAPVLYFGRLSAEKGLTDLLRAMKRLPRIRLQIAGEGPQRRDLEQLARVWNLENVTFLGYVEPGALPPLIAKSRFTIFPSRAFETLGKTILESYANGRAVVASDLGSRRELVRDGETGLLFPPGDVGQLTGAISFLYERPELALHMGVMGRELAHESHSPEAHYRSLASIYESNVSRKRPAAVPASTQDQLKVAFIGGRGVVSRYSGIEAYYEEVGARLAQMGHEVTVYCRNYFTPDLKQHHGMRLVRLPTIRSKHMDTVIHTALSTAHVVFGDSDIVHYHALGPALFSFIPRMMGKKTLVTVQGLDWQRKKWGRFAAAVLRLGEQGAIRLPSATMVVSETLQKYYRDRYGAKTLYVPNGTSLRERRGISKLPGWGLQAEKYILFLGRFSPEKNCHLLIEAYEKLDTEVALVLAGGSSYSDGYITGLRAHESKRIKLLDWVAGEEMEELLSNAMLFVLPSDLEGLSLALLDAMGAGVCVLTSDIPENRELVEGAGFMFRRGDADDLARMLQLLIAEPEIRHAAARTARARIRERYLWPEIAKEIEGHYYKLMGRLPVAAEAPEPSAPEKPVIKEHVA